MNEMCGASSSAAAEGVLPPPRQSSLNCFSLERCVMRLAKLGWRGDFSHQSYKNYFQLANCIILQAKFVHKKNIIANLAGARLGQTPLTSLAAARSCSSTLIRCGAALVGSNRTGKQHWEM